MFKLKTCVLIAAFMMSNLALAAEASFGHIAADDHPAGQAAQRFADIVKSRSKGRLTINIGSNGKMGSEQQLLASLQSGKQDMMFGSTAILAGSVKEYGLFDLPFLFSNFKEVDAVLDGKVGQQLFDKLGKSGVVGLAYWENGFRQLTNSRHKVDKASDIQGLKLRVIPNPIYSDTFKALGAETVPLPFTEVYKALETKAVDGQENPLALIMSTKFYEVQKYVTLTNHAYAPFIVLASARWWNALGADEKQIVKDAAVEAGVFQRKLARELALRAATKELRAQSVEVNILTGEEEAKLREKTRPVFDKYAKTVGEDLVNQARVAIASAR
ncbi:TRAP transporter substrate-binding protein [Noviherbaspirillum galbum]|uniref:TRAP transporter substrate-binding protein n=1 Tax=Noviherbaspirillum galbum TaxID=2709383 RepID=A0A6B3SLW8_9BURK|nr:TRAP transporter substrate-binding protein [Noviherbaspirillum galbum]NEX61790.1 TRAP transporter substrate-binding protein [Noviherbaspirillum galbum]